MNNDGRNNEISLLKGLLTMELFLIVILLLINIIIALFLSIIQNSSNLKQEISNFLFILAVIEIFIGLFPLVNPRGFSHSRDALYLNTQLKGREILKENLRKMFSGTILIIAGFLTIVVSYLVGRS
ncbi:MAG: hypothetical protein ACW981_02445 [Candidatus Hodarchaeales archaeon]